MAYKLRSDTNISGFQLVNDTEHLLELYADDCSIFLKPDSENLRYTVKVLDQFCRLSGLKISFSKTKAIWFGKDAKILDNLCLESKPQLGHQFQAIGCRV